MNVTELVEALEGLEVPMYAPVEIFEIEERGDLRVTLDDDVVTITNDPKFPGEQLWPAT